MEQVRGTMKILLVDDDPFALRVLWRQLVDLGHTDTSSFEQATAALRKLEADPAAFDLVFCDLQMPELDGVEFVRHLARIGYRGGLVLVSGEDTRILQTAQRLAQAQHLKVLGALHKPTTPEKLREVLRLPDTAPATDDAGDERFTPADLAQAIAGGALVNHYQPKVAIASGEVVGVEALVRWRHPSAGIIPPDRFIPIAEQNGLIDPLTQFVLTSALRDAKRWHSAGMNLHVAVNVSTESLNDLAFVDRVTDAVAAARMPMSSLMLEITESQLMRDPVAPLDILTRLRLRHIGLSIDDFGTGHSSLAKLHDLPFSELKIDRSFIHGAWREAPLRSLVEASLGLARQFGMPAVAEGVEDEKDWEYLVSTTCQLAQGYFIARPMPAADLADWVSEWADRRTTLLGHS